MTMIDPRTIGVFIGPAKSRWPAAVVMTIDEAVAMFFARPSAYLITIATRMPPRAPRRATVSVMGDHPWNGSPGLSQMAHGT